LSGERADRNKIPLNPPFSKGEEIQLACESIITRAIPLFAKEGLGEICGLHDEESNHERCFNAFLFLSGKVRSLPFLGGKERPWSLGLLPWVIVGLLLITGCQQKMADQPRYKPLQRSDFFTDQRSERPLVEGTVARGDLKADEFFYTGKLNGNLVDRLPFPITREALLRGQERYNIFCSPCHGQVGTGDGMVVRRGYRPPPSYHIDRLRTAPDGHFFDVMTHGFGAMSDYAEQVPPADRWAIVAYIRALQFSQNAKVADLPEKQRRALAENKR